MTTTTSERETLWDLIKDIKFGMLTHRHANGELHSHPLTTQNKSLDEGSKLYFFISRTSELAQRILQDGNVNVSYANPGDGGYVSVSGSAAIVDDMAKNEELFTAKVKVWFPAGVTDPDLALLVVSVGHAEYWDVTDSKMVQLVKMAKAAVTGEPLKHLAEHKDLHLS